MDNILIYSFNELYGGLFGMVLLFIFEILPILEISSIPVSTIKWNVMTSNYGSIFPNILEYTSEYVEHTYIKKYLKLSDIRSFKPQFVLGDDFANLNKLFFKYFKIPREFETIANSYNLTEFLGIHYRGTDKTTGTWDNEPISKSEFYEVVGSYIKLHGIKRIFIASDEKDILDHFKTAYPALEILSSRNFTENLYWQRPGDVTKNAKEAMIDMMCLSKCKTVLKTSSALSAFSKVINPALEIYRINASKMFADIPYFPDAYIPLLDQSVSKDILEKVQKNDWSYKNKSEFNSFYCRVRA